MAHRRKQQAPSWSAPKQFDEYRLLWQLGRGGMGEVFLGHDTLLDRPVAIKFISAIEPDALMREQFLTEARAAARLQHPNVVTVYRVGEIDGRPYIISEFVRGQNLDHVKLPMPWPRALEMGIGLSRGLAAAHRRGVLHRDIKPGNVILAADGEVKLLDFGLAKFIEAGVMQDLLTEGPSLQRLDMTAPTLDIKSAASSEQPALDLKATPGMPLNGVRESDPDELADTSPRVKVQPQMLIKPGGARPIGPTPFAGNAAVALSNHDSDGDLRRTSGIKGTPLYMAPEVLNGEPATRRSDIYSLGALLYELCVGSPPHYDPLASLEDLRNAANTKSVPPMAGLVPNIEPRFAATIERCLRRQPTERYSSGEELRDALEQLADTAKKDDIPAGNPYRGLLPFEAEHRSLFFGRKSEIGTLVDRLRTEAFVLVAADSGVGKSSLCRAGVLPLVEEGALGDKRNYRQVTLVPGRRPLASLVAAVSRLLTLDEEELSSELRKEPAQLSRILNRQIGTDGGIILFIDQLEELVTIGDAQEVALVGEALGALINRSGNVRLLATVRSDFLARLASVPELGDEISRALYILRPLSPEKIREVIVGPAHKKGASFESETLVTKIVDSTANTDGGLPLLQFALAELWEVKTGDVITAHALESIGGVDGALARHADHVIGRLPPEQRISARRILMSLVTLEGTRARRVEEELVRDGAPARGALEALTRGRLLVARDTPEGPAYEVAHEALIKGWDTLRKWLEEHAEARAVKQRLETAVADWHRLSRSKDVLWSARQVAETRLLERNDIGPKEREFLTASSRQAERRKRLLQLLYLSLPVVAAALYGSVRILATRDLDKRVADAVAEGQKLLAQGQETSKVAEGLRQAAFGLFDQMKREPAEETWAGARKKLQEADREFSTAANTLEAALTLDNRRKDVRGMLGDALYARVLIAEQDHAETLLRDVMQRLPLYDEGGARRRLLSAPGRITISSDPSGTPVVLEQYIEDGQGRRRLTGRRELGSTPLAELTVAAGSYRLTFGPSPGRIEVKYPFIVERGESLSIEAPLPVQAAIPIGFAYVPPGRFLFGAAGEETLRQKFYNTVPSHQVTLSGYLIAVHETTFAEYIDFLHSLPVDKWSGFLPMVGSTVVNGRVELKPIAGDRFTLLLQPGSVAMTAVSGEPIVYSVRQKNAKQDWSRMPVTGISRTEGEAYATWLQRSGRVPGARLCTEQEWERAAKGADDREFPIGSQVQPTDANIDLTYGKKTDTMGPDEVGQYPASRSPFGVDDMLGNVFEIMVSSLAPDETVGRGGSYGFDSLTGRTVNRNPVDSSWRAADAGVRICAPFQLGSAHPGANLPGTAVPSK